jgi:hypothetical protein
MKTHQAARPAAIVFSWSRNAAPATVREVARRIVGLGAPATWALEQASQIESLVESGLSRRDLDVAMIAEGADADSVRSTDDAVARELARRLDVLRDSGSEVSVIQASSALATGAWPRLLRALGIRGIVVASQGAAAPHALPFGVWNFAPHSVLPRPRRWFDWLRGRQPLIAAHIPGSAIVTIDLGRAGEMASRTGREIASALDEVAAAHRDGAIALTTLGELTARLSEASAPRPQRSILRAA